MVIGRGGKDIAPAGAAGHIFGYTLFNDFSARDQQAAEMAGGLGPTKGKSFDTGNAMGPWIVTADEIGIALDLPARVRVNGDVWAEGRTTGMLHGIPQVLSFISSSETLHPGEVIALGTVGGCCGLEIGRFLQPGDVVELEAGPLGTLRNTVGMRQNTA